MSINQKSVGKGEIECKKVKLSTKKVKLSAKRWKLKKNMIDSSYFELGQTNGGQKF